MASPPMSPRSAPTGFSRPPTRGVGSDSEVSNMRERNLEREVNPLNQELQDGAPGENQLHKLNQIVQNYHTKAALTILQARVELPAMYVKGAKRMNKWFNVELEDTDAIRDDLTHWRTCNVTDKRPVPLVIETYLDTSQLSKYQNLTIVDDYGKRWDVLEALESIPKDGASSHKKRNTDVVLERWHIELGEMSAGLPSDLGSILPNLYKKSIVLFRSLFAYSKFLPAWKFHKRQSRVRNPELDLHYRIRRGNTQTQKSKTDNLTVPLYEGDSEVVENYSFGVTESPAGPFTIQVTYRNNCEFLIEDAETLLSSRFMGNDDNLFRPSLPSDIMGQHESGSLPLRQREINVPDLGQAYGSMSTFHQADPAVKASPISALRAARDFGGVSPSPPSRSPLSPKLGHGRVASLANEGSQPTHQRRSSVSHQPFKAPPLSASPLGAQARSPSTRTEPINMPPEREMPPPPRPASRNASRQDPSENTITSPISASPKSAPVSKYSSSFSHRRGRLSTGGGSKTEEDNTSSGRASISSSAMHPSSGVLAEGGEGASAGSLQADEDNISDFLKLLDQRKDLLSPGNSTMLDSANRKTSVALSRFQKMRDANNTLSDSMTSSLILHRSSVSSSRQLPNVPPMVAGTSMSTSSSPGKAVSPHTPHTPAIPSRLSANSVIEYPDDNATGPQRQRLAHEPDESPLEETSDEATLENAPINTNAIDIPTSPHPFIPSFRRSSSVAQRRTTTAVEEDMGDFLPFCTRSISLGAEERSPPTLSELLQQQIAEPAPVTSAETQNDAPAEKKPATKYSQVSSAASGQAYQPRFAHYRGRIGSMGGPQSPSSASSSIGRGHPLPAQMIERDREVGNGSGSNSGISMTTDTRRGSGHRFSFNRHTSQPWNNFDEDEPLLFAMSDFGVSRRSLEEAPRNVPAETEGPLSGLRGSAPGKDTDKTASNGGNPCSFYPWD